MAVGPDGIDWDALAALTRAGLSPDDIRRLATMQRPSALAPGGMAAEGGRKTVRTPGIRLPEAPALPTPLSNKPGAAAAPGSYVQVDGRLVAGELDDKGNVVPPGQTTGTSGAQNAASSEQIASSSAVLREWGLERLIPVMESYMRSGRSFAEFQLGFYDAETEQGKVVDEIYPWWRERQKRGNPIAIGSGVAYINQAKALMRSAGLPQGFYDTSDDFNTLIVGDVSISELTARIQDGYVAASNMTREGKEEFSRLFGVGLDTGTLAAYYLNPERALPEIHKQVAAAKLGGAAKRVGLSFNRPALERFGELGIDEGDSELLGQVAFQHPILGQLAKRFNDPDDPLTAEEFTEALAVGDMAKLSNVARLFSQDASTYSDQEFAATDRMGAQRGLLAR